MIDRRDFLRLASGAATAARLGADPADKPNFLVILADDMGFSDARCYGGDVDTPNLDRLAAGGLRFTQAYSTARCGPSRSCLLTGYYAQQTASDVMTPGNVPGLHAIRSGLSQAAGLPHLSFGQVAHAICHGPARRWIRSFLHDVG